MCLPCEGRLLSARAGLMEAMTETSSKANSAWQLYVPKLVTVLRRGYGIKDFQISGAPPWFMSERYDIEAKAAGNPSLDEFEKVA